ncbi:MAG: hypothetical protein ACR2GD_13845 [Pyrinomonadaceae bacterium]
MLRGKVREIRTMSDALLSLKGVKHGRLFVTLNAAQMVERKSAAHARAHSHKHPH